MLRTAMMMFALAFSTVSIGCVDEDPTDGPKKSNEDDPDFDEPTDDERDTPTGCRANLQDEDDADCNPKL
jgi:hypothetical protein